MLCPYTSAFVSLGMSLVILWPTSIWGCFTSSGLRSRSFQRLGRRSKKRRRILSSWRSRGGLEPGRTSEHSSTLHITGALRGTAWCEACTCRTSEASNNKFFENIPSCAQSFKCFYKLCAMMQSGERVVEKPSTVCLFYPYPAGYKSDC